MLYVTYGVISGTAEGDRGHGGMKDRCNVETILQSPLTVLVPLVAKMKKTTQSASLYSFYSV